MLRKGENWFMFCGSICDEDEHMVAIANGITNHSPPQSGELCLFANDLDSKYDNNMGSIEVVMERTA